MNRHINYQLIEKNGHPLFAILPYEELLDLLRTAEVAEDDQVTIPDAVVKMVVIEKMHPIKAWRKYRGLSQQVLAKKLGVKQPVIVKLEKSNASLRKNTQIKLAKALEIKASQLLF